MLQAVLGSPQTAQNSPNGIVIESFSGLFAPQQKVEKFAVRQVQQGFERQDFLDRQA